MQTIQQHICAVIPPHMLRHLAAQCHHEARDYARATLERMRELAVARVWTAPETPAEMGLAAATSKKRRNVYDARRSYDLPGELVMSEHKARSADVAVSEAYDGAGVAFDFFGRAFSRNSIDGRGMRLDSTVHYGTGFGNAMWSGHHVVYGDGDGILFNRFTASLELQAHEYMHGITQCEANLRYWGQTGALNEHLTDAFGIMAKQFALRHTAWESDWLIGAGLFTSRVHGKAVRSMAAPGTAYDDPALGRDPQPAHMRHYVDTDEDNGGVHINSGIPNHAFHLAAMAIGGWTWEVLGPVWYEVLTERLRSDAVFDDLAQATIDVAGEMHGNGGSVQQCVVDAWTGVGLRKPIFNLSSTRNTHTKEKRS